MSDTEDKVAGGCHESGEAVCSGTTDTPKSPEREDTIDTKDTEDTIDSSTDETAMKPMGKEDLVRWLH